MRYQPHYDYNTSLGSVEPFDPKDQAIQVLAHEKKCGMKVAVADALGIHVSELPDFGGKLYIVQLQTGPSDWDNTNLLSDIRIYDHVEDFNSTHYLYLMGEICIPTNEYCKSDEVRTFL